MRLDLSVSVDQKTHSGRCCFSYSSGDSWSCASKRVFSKSTLLTICLCYLFQNIHFKYCCFLFFSFQNATLLWIRNSERIQFWLKISQNPNKTPRHTLFLKHAFRESLTQKPLSFVRPNSAVWLDSRQVKGFKEKSSELFGHFFDCMNLVSKEQLLQTWNLNLNPGSTPQVFNHAEIIVTVNRLSWELDVSLVLQVWCITSRVKQYF